MKTHLKHLLGLALMVLVLAGCSNPAGPEIPEDNVKLVKVEFVWDERDEDFEGYALKYFLGLYFDQKLECYVYDFPEDFDKNSYPELLENTKRLKEVNDDAFEKAFGTKYYKEGDVIDLKQWTSKAKRITHKGVVSKMTTWSYFSTKDINSAEIYDIQRDGIESPFDQIVVGSEDIVIYVCFNNNIFE